LHGGTKTIEQDVLWWHSIHGRRHAGRWRWPWPFSSVQTGALPRLRPPYVARWHRSGITAARRWNCVIPGDRCSLYALLMDVNVEVLPWNPKFVRATAARTPTPSATWLP
jgi:hypothetical protein